MEKFRFYERYGVEEYYQYDPDLGILDGWLRRNGTLEPIDSMDGWVSPRLGTQFRIDNDALVVYRPDGEPFLPYVQLRQRMEQAQQRAEAAEQRAQRLAERLREIGIDPEEV